LSEVVTLRPHNATHDYIDADLGILQEISERFTFLIPGAKFNPRVKAKVWDGKISLITPYKPYLYVGLRNELAKFCRARDYELNLSKIDLDEDEFTIEQAHEFIDSLNLPDELNGIPFEKKRDYQVDAFIRAVKKKRLTLLSPTSSGKSYIIYLFHRFFNKKTLIIVPTLGLVRQMKGDFADYGYDSERNVHQIFSGQDKETDKPITVSTWQSLSGMPSSFFDQFEVLVCDEVHGAKAKELKETVEKMVDCRVRLGTTGTLDGMKVNELVIQGLFGPIHKVITSRELMDQGKIANLKIMSIILEHTQENKKLMARAKYPDEMSYLIRSEARNNFIKNLALSLKGNTLILFQYVEKHGEPLHALITGEATCPVLYVAGSVELDEREEVRKFINTQTQSITVASKGVFSTGTNIPNIDNIIFASPSKARIQTLQSIGRGLRLSNRKTVCVLYDVADDLTWKSWTNHTLNHYVERAKIYASESFQHKAYPVALKA
jgi:superfamily II DNA or RNA helicase